MTSLPATRPTRQREPLRPVSVAGRFVGGATDDDLRDGAAVLQIWELARTVLYWCAGNYDRGNLVGFRLRKFDAEGAGDVYDLPATLDACSCADGTFRPERPGGCRHQRALRQAMASRVADLPPVV